MKKLLFLIILLSASLSQAQSTRNDSYSAFGILSSPKQIPFGISFYNVSKDQKFGFFTELKFNRLSFHEDYAYMGYPEDRDVYRNALFIENNNLIKMINFGTVINPQEIGVINWDFIDIDFCLGIGYIQNFQYKFYNDTKGIGSGIIDENGNTVAEDSPLGKYYVIDYNSHGVNLNFGTNLSFQRLPFMIHIGYDTRPKTLAIGFNWKVK